MESKSVVVEVKAWCWFSDNPVPALILKKTSKPHLGLSELTPWCLVPQECITNLGIYHQPSDESLPKPMLIYFELDLQEQASLKFEPTT